MISFSSGKMILFFFSSPPITRSIGTSSLEIKHIFVVFIFAGSNQRCLVANVGNISAGKTGPLFRQFMYIQRLRYFDRQQVDLEDGFAPNQVGPVNGDLPVKPSRS